MASNLTNPAKGLLLYTSMEIADEPSNNYGVGGYETHGVHGGEYDPGVHDGYGVVPDDELLPTEISPHIASHTEGGLPVEVDSHAVELKAVFNRIDSAAHLHDDFKQERAIISKRIAHLDAERLVVEKGITDTENEVKGILPRARAALWERTSLRGDAVVNGERLADAIRLSPQDDGLETSATREARVQAVMALSSEIHRSVPTVIMYGRSDGENAMVAYCAGVPRHDGFSFSMDDSSEGHAAFKVGINQDTPVPATELVNVVVVPTNDGRAPYVDTMPTVTIRTGEEATAFLGRQCASVIDTIIELDQSTRTHDSAHSIWDPATVAAATEAYRQKDAARWRLVTIFAAARAIETRVTIPDQDQVARMVSEYLLDLGDAHADTRSLIYTGRALRDVFAGNDEQTIEHLIAASNARRFEKHTKHNLVPIVNTLVHVCHADQLTIMKRLLNPGINRG